MKGNKSEKEKNCENANNELKKNCATLKERSEEDIKRASVQYIVKILLASDTAWSISSRNETKVAWMYEKFESDVRLSRNDDFYPGTKDRVCIIHGNIKQITVTLDWILSIATDVKNQIHQQQIKMLIPKTSLGALINRGYGIQNLSEKEGVEIYVPEHSEAVLREVCTTITGQKDNIIRTSISIAKIIKYDPFSAICRNYSYEEFNIYLRRKEHQTFSNFINTPRISIKPTPPAPPPPMIHPWGHHQQQQQLRINQYQHQKHFIPPQRPIHPFVANSYYNQTKQNQQQIFFEGQQPKQLSLIEQQQQQIQQLQTQMKQELELKEESIIDNKVSSQPINESTDNIVTSTPKKEEISTKETGNPIPSVTSFWRRASTDNWRSNNNRALNNGQSNVEVIPGFN